MNQKPKIVTLANQKGGAGKSMMAINLAIAAEMAGESVAIIDLDKQGTVANWYNTRIAATPRVEAPAFQGVVHLSLDGLIARLGGEGCTLIVIDTKGEDSYGTRPAMMAADLCLIPVRPAGPDLHAIGPTVQALTGMNKDYALVINQALTNKKAKLTATIMAGLAQASTVIPMAVAARASFQKAYGLGQGVIEFEPNGAAADEIRGLWAWCSKHLAGASEEAAHVAG